MCYCQIMLFWIKYKLTQPVSFVSKSANSESMHGVQMDPVGSNRTPHGMIKR